MARGVRKQIHTIPLHIGDWVNGTCDMTTLEVGAYIRLVVKNYANGPDGLPDDDRRLATIAGMTLDKWKKVAPAVRQKFQSQGGKLHSARALQVMKNIIGKNSGNDDNYLNYKETNHKTDEKASTQPESRIHKPESINHAAINSSGQQSKKNSLAVSTREQCDSAKDGEIHYDPEAVEYGIFPGGWADYAESVGVGYERAYKSWEKFKGVTDYPFHRSRWVAWIKNEGNQND